MHANDFVIYQRARVRWQGLYLLKSETSAIT